MLPLGKKRKRGAKKPNTNGGAPPSGGTALVVAAPAPAAAALGLDFDMAAETAKLEAKMGKDADGKSPCYFHHTPGKKCKFEAKDCKRYH